MKSGEVIELSVGSLNVGSSAYSTFSLLCEKPDTYIGFVMCQPCKKIIKHNSHLSGTTHLSRHASGHVKPTTQTAKKTQTPTTGFVTRKEFYRHQMLLPSCAADLRPFSSVEGIGFQHLAQTLITIGSKYGNINMTDILPSRTTVAETCRSEASVARADLVYQINTYVKRYGIIGVTTDM